MLVIDDNLVKCHLVHGFNIKDGGRKTVDRLIPQLECESIEMIEHDYGYLNIWGILRNENKQIASDIKYHLGADDVAIGHSNGAAILVKALQQGAMLDKLILVNAALDKNFVFPDTVNEIHVFHSKHDKTVIGAKWLRKMVFWRNTFLWGEMGNTGYKGDDPRVTNHEINTRHSAVFRYSNIVEFSDKVLSIIKRK